MESRPALRTRVYVDGYNFYYGVLKCTPYKWLDLLRLFERHILPSIEVRAQEQPATSELLPLSIKYFTASIVEKLAKAEDSVSSQASYHRALRHHQAGRIEIVQGAYSLSQVRMKQVDPGCTERWPRDCSEVLVWKAEEKKSDVALALQLFHDTLSGEVEHAVVASNDTDLTPAFEMVREHTHAVLGLVVPTRDKVRRPNEELSALAHWTRRNISEVELGESQLPRVIASPRKPATKPLSWYAQPECVSAALIQATQIRGSRSEAWKWLQSPNPYMGDARPIDLLDTPEGAEQVMAYIRAYRDLSR